VLVPAHLVQAFAEYRVDLPARASVRDGEPPCVVATGKGKQGDAVAFVQEATRRLVRVEHLAIRSEQQHAARDAIERGLGCLRRGLRGAQSLRHAGGARQVRDENPHALALGVLERRLFRCPQNAAERERAGVRAEHHASAGPTCAALAQHDAGRPGTGHLAHCVLAQMAHCLVVDPVRHDEGVAAGRGAAKEQPACAAEKLRDRADYILPRARVQGRFVDAADDLQRLVVHRGASQAMARR
jgi:hypothetical protein